MSSCVAGHETVGVVAAIGAKVKDFKVGERVVADNSVSSIVKHNIDTQTDPFRGTLRRMLLLPPWRGIAL